MNKWYQWMIAIALGILLAQSIWRIMWQVIDLLLSLLTPVKCLSG